MLKAFRIECILPDSVSIGKSGLNGFGLFSNRSFRKDEAVYVNSFQVVNYATFPPEIELIANGIPYLFTSHNHITPYINGTYAVYSFDSLMNHHCEPSTHDKAHSEDPLKYTVFAARDILQGEELTCNYNTFKWINDSPFDCSCGSAKCCGKVAGYSQLSEQHKRDIKQWTETSALMLKSRGLS